MNTLRTLLILVIFVVVINLESLEGLQCYNCETNDWNINGSCEIVDESTPKIDCNETCWSYLTDKDHGLVRGCFSKDEIDTLQKLVEINRQLPFCITDLCNKHYEIPPEEGEPNYPAKYMPCFRCSSTKENPHKPCYVSKGTQNDQKCPLGRICVLYYKSESEDIQQNCHVWSEVLKVINAPPSNESWTILWCKTEEYCNLYSETTHFPGCEWYYSPNEAIKTPTELDGCVFKKATQGEMGETKLTNEGATDLENKGTTGGGCVFATNMSILIFMNLLLALLKN